MGYNKYHIYKGLNRGDGGVDIPNLQEITDNWYWSRIMSKKGKWSSQSGTFTFLIFRKSELLMWGQNVPISCRWLRVARDDEDYEDDEYNDDNEVDEDDIILSDKSFQMIKMKESDS